MAIRARIRAYSTRPWPSSRFRCRLIHAWAASMRAMITSFTHSSLRERHLVPRGHQTPRLTASTLHELPARPQSPKRGKFGSQMDVLLAGTGSKTWKSPAVGVEVKPLVGHGVDDTVAARSAHDLQRTAHIGIRCRADPEAGRLIGVQIQQHVLDEQYIARIPQT